VKAEGRLRFLATLLVLLAASVVVGALIYQTTYDTLRRSYQQMLERNVDQGVFLLEEYLNNQYTLLSLYAAVPSVAEGRFSDLPGWLKEPGSGRGSPKRLAILDRRGRGVATTGARFEAGDRAYFLEALGGQRNIAGPVVSRIDNQSVVVVAEPVPGNHDEAAVLTASIDLKVFRDLLGSIRGLSGTDMMLISSTGTLATTVVEGAREPGPDEELLTATRTLGPVPWTLSARVRVADLMQPVRSVLLVVGVLVVVGALLILVFFLTGLRHRRDLDQAREDRTQALRDAYEQIRKLAYHDTVTRLPNRNLVMRRLTEAVQDSQNLRVIVVALARFRSLTTTFGMHFGDIILRETTRRLGTLLGPNDFLGRLGGSEFILLLEEETHGPGTLDQILELFQPPMGREDLKLHVGVHIGACRLKTAGTNAEEIIKSAETALWASRERGPNEASELTQEAVEQRLRRAQLQKLLPAALERGEFQVHYQPQVNMQTGFIEGYEALLRWTSPELGPVSPVEFIPVAEETGFIVALGYWVLDQGILFAQDLAARGTPAVVSVNVSPVQFLHHNFLDEVHRKVEAAHLPPRSLGLEITESTLMEGIDQLRPSLGRIMASGVKVSLDDFGTGYSSLNYLKDLPLHVLKIDKSFIDALDTDERAFRLIECIIDLAHHLGLIVVAEGIETGRQHAVLAGVGCDLVQGFYTGRPRPASDHLGGELP